MKLTLDATAAQELDTDCLVIGIFEHSDLQGSAELIDRASNGALQQLIKSGDIDTNWKHTTLLHGLDGVAAKRIRISSVVSLLDWAVKSSQVNVKATKLFPLMFGTCNLRKAPRISFRHRV